jgi:hypothetical protein
MKPSSVRCGLLVQIPRVHSYCCSGTISKILLLSYIAVNEKFVQIAVLRQQLLRHLHLPGSLNTASQAQPFLT